MYFSASEKVVEGKRERDWEKEGGKGEGWGWGGRKKWKEKHRCTLYPEFQT